MLGMICFPQANSLRRIHKLLSINCSSNSFKSLYSLSNSNLSFSQNPISNLQQNKKLSATPTPISTTSIESPISGFEDGLVSYILGKKKATEAAHLIWKHIVQKGDTVVDATCGNGYDTLAMLKLVADESGNGHVYGLDIQRDALDSTSSFLDRNVNPNEKELVKLFPICHSKMEEVVPENIPVRLIAFNLGYLPGGDKAIKTIPETTRLALDAGKRILMPGGLISLVVYVGHRGGREELDVVKTFASGLSVDDWVCCNLQMLNRPLAPVLVFLFKR